MTKRFGTNKNTEKLKEWLFKKGKTQKELAESLGVTLATISNIINNRYNASDRLKFKIKNKTGVSLQKIYEKEK